MLCFRLQNIKMYGEQTLMENDHFHHSSYLMHQQEFYDDFMVKPTPPQIQQQHHIHPLPTPPSTPDKLSNDFFQSFLHHQPQQHPQPQHQHQQHQQHPFSPSAGG